MLTHSRKLKGRFIHDQSLFSLDLPAGRRAAGMVPAVFVLAEHCDRKPERRQFRFPEGDKLDEENKQLGVAENLWKVAERVSVLQNGALPNEKPWQHLCVSIGAGVGKTTSLEQMEYLLNEHNPESLNILIPFSEIIGGVNQIMGTSVEIARAKLPLSRPLSAVRPRQEPRLPVVRPHL